MKLRMQLDNKQMTVSKDPEEKQDTNGRQKTERDTGRPMWQTQVFVLDPNDGGEVIRITTAGEKPTVKLGQLVTVSDLEALPWANVNNGQLRQGVAYRASSLKGSTAPAPKQRLPRCSRDPPGRLRRSFASTPPRLRARYRITEPGPAHRPDA